MTQYNDYIKLNKNSIQILLKEFAKEYKRQLGKTPKEVQIYEH